MSDMFQGMPTQGGQLVDYPEQYNKADTGFGTLSAVPKGMNELYQQQEWQNSGMGQGLIDVSAMFSPMGVGKAANLFGKASQGMKAPLSWAEGVAAGRGQGLQDAGRRSAMQTGAAVGGGLAAAGGAGVVGNTIAHAIPAAKAAQAPISLAHLQNRQYALTELLNPGLTAGKQPGVLGKLATAKANSVDDILVDMASRGQSVTRRGPNGRYMEPTHGVGAKPVQAGDVNFALSNPENAHILKDVNPDILKRSADVTSQYDKKINQVEKMRNNARYREHFAQMNEKPVLSAKELKTTIAERRKEHQNWLDEYEWEYGVLPDKQQIASSGSLQKAEAMKKQLNALSKTGKYGSLKEETLPF